MEQSTLTAPASKIFLAHNFARRSAVGGTVSYTHLDVYKRQYLISVVNPGQMNEAWKHYQGRKCYEVLQGRSTPCPFCTNHQLAQDRYLVWEYRNPILQRNYILKDKLVNWKGKQVRMEVVIDVNDPRRISRVLRDNIECQNILIGCIPVSYTHRASLPSVTARRP